MESVASQWTAILAEEYTEVLDRSSTLQSNFANTLWQQNSSNSQNNWIEWMCEQTNEF